MKIFKDSRDLNIGELLLTLLVSLLLVPVLPYGIYWISSYWFDRFIQGIASLTQLLLCYIFTYGFLGITWLYALYELFRTIKVLVKGDIKNKL